MLSVSKVERGDVDAALAGAAHVVTESFRTQFIEHAFLEPESSLAVPDEDGRLEVYSQGQGVWDDRRQIASFLGASGGPRARHAGRRPAVRSGRRRTSTSSATPPCSPCAPAVRCCVTLTRKESLRFHSKRHPMWLDYTVGCDEDGPPARGAGPHRRRHRRVRERRRQGDRARRRSRLRRLRGRRTSTSRAQAVYTNNPPCGAMRGFGVNQSNFADRGRARHARRAVGIDGWEIRWRNALEVGRAVRHRPEARPGRRPQADAARRQGRLPRAPASRGSPAASRTPASATA